MKFFKGDKTVLELQSSSFVVWPQKNNAPMLIQDDESAGEKTGSDTGFKPCSLAGQRQGLCFVLYSSVCRVV